VKKLLALLVVGGLLALTTGCPPGTTSGPAASPTPGPSGTPNPIPNPPSAKPTEAKGTVKSAAKDKVVITDADKKDWDLIIIADTKITIDGKEGSADKIPVGASVTATKMGDKVTKIDATSGGAPPPPPPPGGETTAKGKVKSAAKDKVTITDADGKDWDLAVTPDTAVTVDGKKGAAEDIKKGSEVTATKKGDAVTEIKATSPK